MEFINHQYKEIYTPKLQAKICHISEEAEFINYQYRQMQNTFVLIPCWLGATRMLLEEVEYNKTGFYS